MPIRYAMSRAGASYPLLGSFPTGAGQEGAALVEMAISTALFLSILIGIVYFMFGLYAYSFVADAAREASRYASTRGSQSCTNAPILNDCNATGPDIQAMVQSIRYPGLSASNLIVTTTWLQANTRGATGWATCTPGPCSNAPGNMVKVVVTYAYPINVPFWARTTIDVSSTSQMVISQ